MGSISQQDYINMLLRLKQPKHRLPPMPNDAVEEEIPLHGKIMQWCRENNVPYIHARTDRKSTINVGSPDFSFPYRGKHFYIEVKTRTGKRSPAQIAWGILAEMNGAVVRECRSFSEFMSIVKP